MEKKELNKLKRAIRNMKNENDTLYIIGDKFSCRWNGKSYIWKVNGRTYENCTIKEVLSWVDNGEYITNYCYDYDNVIQ